MIDGTLIIIMEFCEGKHLFFVLRKETHTYININNMQSFVAATTFRGRFSFPHKAEEKQKGKVT